MTIKGIYYSRVVEYRQSTMIVVGQQSSCTRLFSVLNLTVMKQYVIDELRLGDYDKLNTHLAQRFGPADLGGVFWIPVDSEHLTETQASHTDCKPFYFAVELQESALSCELLVRTRERIRCDCIAYATRTQRDWIVKVIDRVFDQLDIHT